MAGISDGFGFPLGTVDAGGRRTATEANDGDGFYVAGQFTASRKPMISVNVCKVQGCADAGSAVLEKSGRLGDFSSRWGVSVKGSG